VDQDVPASRSATAATPHRQLGSLSPETLSTPSPPWPDVASSRAEFDRVSFGENMDLKLKFFADLPLLDPVGLER
jgi:hypothetical protein